MISLRQTDTPNPKLMPHLEVHVNGSTSFLGTIFCSGRKDKMRSKRPINVTFQWRCISCSYYRCKVGWELGFLSSLLKPSERRKVHLHVAMFSKKKWIWRTAHQFLKLLSGNDTWYISLTKTSLMDSLPFWGNLPCDRYLDTESKKYLVDITNDYRDNNSWCLSIALFLFYGVLYVLIKVS